MKGINEKEKAQKGSSPAELGKWAEYVICKCIDWIRVCCFLECKI